jgi:hypothetical protein
MKQHNGMRPHDIVILLKIAAKGASLWLMKDLAYELGISASEVSESLHRSMIAGLIAQDKKRLMKQSLLEFLEHGLCYVYPQRPGGLVRGILTAHSASPISELIASEAPYVWPFTNGKVRGQSIDPLHPKVAEACLRDERFYELMALCDVLRLGKTREKHLAVAELKKRLL